MSAIFSTASLSIHLNGDTEYLSSPILCSIESTQMLERKFTNIHTFRMAPQPTGFTRSIPPSTTPLK